MAASLFGRYEIRQELGRGGMAQVYLAYDPTFRRQVAVKVLPPHYLENPLLRARFEREARLIATIEHPAIVPVYDFGEQDGQLYLVMRYMSGGSLVSLIRQGPFSLSKAAEMLSLLAPALDAVHARGIVHRDLKPGNILLDSFGNPALSDFGIAHFSEATVDLTGAAVIGTPAYMSPEQVRAEIALDGRSDIYSLGIILYEMLTGRQPYQAATPMSIAMRHLTDPVPEIRRHRPDLPVTLQSVLDRALAKDRDQRYPRAADLVYDLRALVDASPSGAIAPVPVDEATQVDPASLVAPLSQAAALPPTQVDPDSLPGEPAQPVNAGTPPPSLASAAQTPALPRKSTYLPWLLLVPVVCILALGLILAVRYLLPSLAVSPSPSAPPQAAATSTHTPAMTLQVVDTVAPPDTPTPLAPTSPPTLTATLSPEPVLFDDFSTAANGWPQGNQAAGSYAYQDGAYTISVLQNGDLLWAAPQASFADARLDVRAQRLSGDQGYYGLLCRLQDADNFYYFIIRPDGYFAIGKYQAGSFSALTPGGWTYHPAIQTGDAANLLQAECAGDELRFFANGQLLGEARDAEVSAGYPALVVAALDDGGFQALFDDFTVYSSVP
jgi:serine/threonine protein kinase